MQQPLPCHAKTGVTAAQSLNILVEGGQLTVSFQAEENTYTNIDLQGPATLFLKEKSHEPTEIHLRALEPRSDFSMT